jgi:hypothetical protein
MGKNKLKTALFLVILSVFALFIVRRALTIRSTLKSIGEYQRILEVTKVITPSDLETMEQEAEELRSRGSFAVEAAQTTEDRVSTIRDLLQAQGAKPEQFRITGTGKDAAAEFTINCPPLPFFTALLELSKNNMPALAYISIRPDPVSGNIKSTLRFANEAASAYRGGIYEDAPEPLPPRVLAASFRAMGAQNPPPGIALGAVPAPIRREINAAPAEKKNLKYLGSIKDSIGQEWVYVKDRDTGQIIAAHSAVPASANQDAYVVTIGGNEWIIRRD